MQMNEKFSAMYLSEHFNLSNLTQFYYSAFDVLHIGPWHTSAFRHLDIPCHCAYVHPHNGSRPPFPALTVSLCNFSILQF
jgi:hypothetical protein